LWRAIGDLQILSFYPDDLEAKRRLARNRAVQSVPHLQAYWQTMLGDNLFRDGNPDKAMQHWTRAAEVLDVVRAKLPPVELRAAFMRGRGDPYERIIAGEMNTNPRRAAAWTDRFKTVGAWAAPGAPFSAVRIRTRAEQSLTELARQVLSLAGKIEEIGGTRGNAATGSQQVLRRLQGQTRDYLAMIGSRRPRLDRWIGRFTRDLTRVATNLPVVQFHRQGNDFIAFIHVGGQTRLQRFPGAVSKVREWCGIWHIQMNRAILSEGGTSRADLEHEKILFEELGQSLWEPLGISPDCKQVLIIPDGQLSNLPWSAFITGGEPVAARHSLTLSPTVQHHVHAAGLKCKGERFGWFVGPVTGLAHARDELTGLIEKAGELYLVDPCRREDWPHEGDWRVWHFSGHARYRADNPFYSSLELADGPLFAADFRLKNCRVGLVTLAACRTAHQPSLPGEESTGLIRCLLEMGTRNVVGSHWAVSDRSAAAWMKLFYEAVLSGQTVSNAVREASLGVREKYPSVYDWASFSVFGAG
jgi:hypothetical protein